MKISRLWSRMSVVRGLMSVVGVLMSIGTVVSVRAEVVSVEWVRRLAESMRTTHPVLRGGDLRAEAGHLDGEAVRRYADPMLMVGGSVYRREGMPDQMGDVIYGVRQPLPVMGKETAVRAMGRARAGVESTRAQAVFEAFRRDLALALLDAAWEVRRTALIEKDIEWIGARVATVRAAFPGLQVDAPEWLEMENRLARRKLDQAQALGRLESARALVDRFLGQMSDEEVAGLELPELHPEIIWSEGLLERARGLEPGMRVLEREKQLAEAGLKTSRTALRPDLALGFDARHYSGDAGFREGMFSLSITLPWANRASYRREIERDAVRVESVEADRETRRLEISEALHSRVAQANAARREGGLIQDDLLPRTRRLVGIVEARWAGRSTGLDALLSARQEWLEWELEHARARLDQARAIHELLYLSGVDEIERLYLPLDVSDGTDPLVSDVKIMGSAAKAEVARESEKEKKETR